MAIALIEDTIVGVEDKVDGAIIIEFCFVTTERRTIRDLFICPGSLARSFAKEFFVSVQNVGIRCSIFGTGSHCVIHNIENGLGFFCICALRGNLVHNTVTATLFAPIPEYIGCGGRCANTAGGEVGHQPIIGTSTEISDLIRVTVDIGFIPVDNTIVNINFIAGGNAVGSGNVLLIVEGVQGVILGFDIELTSAGV